MSPTRARAGRAPALLALALSTAFALGVSGCTAPEPEPEPTPSRAAAAPVFASDEEALDAAVAAYERYNEVFYEISADPSADLDRLAEIVTPDYAPTLVAEQEAMRNAGLMTVGRPALSSMRLMDRWTADGIVTVQIYACLEYEAFRIVRSSDAQDVTPSDRDPSSLFLVTTRSRTNDEPADLVVENSEPWSRSSGC